MPRSLRLQMALTGRLEEWQDDVRLSWLKSVRGSVEDALDYGKTALRSDLRGAGLGNIQKTWRSEIFPRRGLAYEPTGFIYSKAEYIIQAFDEGRPIRGRSGGFLAVPIPGSPAEDLKPKRGTGRSRVQAAREKFGDERLFVIPGKAGRAPILAAKLVGFNKAGRLVKKKPTKSGKLPSGTATVPLFFLVEEVSLDRRLDVRRRFRQIQDRFTDGFARRIGDELRRQGVGGK